MADDTPPSELVQARRDFRAADAELARIAAGAPSAFSEGGSVVRADPEVAARMDAVRAEMRELAEFIAGHEWIIRSGNRFAAWQQVDAAAKAAE